jgi:hypothetical protein
LAILIHEIIHLRVQPQFGFIPIHVQKVPLQETTLPQEQNLPVHQEALILVLIILLGLVVVQAVVVVRMEAEDLLVVAVEDVSFSMK